MVGIPQVINCTVSAVIGVESNLVLISWMGPLGSITNDNRMTISPTISSGNTYTSSLEFEYLAEEDEGNYTCDVMILDTIRSEYITMSLISTLILTNIYKLSHAHNLTVVLLPIADTTN